ncbi:MAG: ABC transporter substrate-binding protein [Alphaproteobacteria bacterium]|nr:ABC transporter substrate-binding protein [Alphaproteobacteria bacterium]MDD9920324.1 ABC transporter substrate-binding protein [Alphaproteobacteria bacterium]
MTRFLIGLLTLVCWFSSANTHAEEMAEAELYNLVRGSSNKILNAMTVEGDAASKKEKIRGVLEEVLEPLVDFESISKAVMGKHYSMATEEQRKEFTNVLQETMVGLYTKVLVNFEIDELKVERPNLNSPFKGSVSMKVTAGNGAVYNIVYSVRQSPEGEWKVRNVILDGINLGLTYRNQFYSAANSFNSDLDKVISTWGNDEKTASAN